MSDLHDDESLARTERAIDGWLAAFAAASPAVRAVDRDTETSRWFVRLAGEAKDFTTVWLTLGQRTLRYETYVMPAPEANAAELYEHLLRRNERLIGGEEDLFTVDARLFEDGRGEVVAAGGAHRDLTGDEGRAAVADGARPADGARDYRALARIDGSMPGSSCRTSR